MKCSSFITQHEGLARRASVTFTGQVPNTNQYFRTLGTRATVICGRQDSQPSGTPHPTGRGESAGHGLFDSAAEMTSDLTPETRLATAAFLQ